MRKSYITKREIAKAEKILKRLNEVKFGIRNHLEAMCDCSVTHDDRQDEGKAFMDRLFGALEIMYDLELVSFEEENLLSRYFINKRVEKRSAKRHERVA